jgi:hypothetical protein
MRRLEARLSRCLFLIAQSTTFLRETLRGGATPTDAHFNLAVGGKLRVPKPQPPEN